MRRVQDWGQCVFHRTNLQSAAKTQVVAHDGKGEISFSRIMHHAEGAGGCHFIDHAVIPPGVSIGRHRHTAHEEEFYLVLSGQGRMWQEGNTFEVIAGDLIRNAPGGAHGLENTGDTPLELFVFEVGVPAPRQGE